MKKFISENSIGVFVYIIAIIILLGVFFVSDLFSKFIIIIVLAVVGFCLFKISNKNWHNLYKSSNHLIPLVGIVILFFVFALYKIDLLPFRINFFEYEFLRAFSKGQIDGLYVLSHKSDYLFGVNQYLVAFINFIINFVGSNILFLRIFSVITFAFALILSFIFFKQLTDNKVIPYIAIFLIAVSPWSWLISRTGFLESFILVVLLLTLIALIKALKTNKTKWYLFTGLCAALCAYIRLEYAFIIVISLLIMCIAYFTTKKSSEIRIRDISITLISFILAASPLIVYCFLNTKTFVLLNIFQVKYHAFFNYLYLLCYIDSAENIIISSILGLFFLLGFILILKQIKEKENYFVVVFFVLLIFLVLNDKQLELYYSSVLMLPFRYFIISFALYVSYKALLDNVIKNKKILSYSFISVMAVIVLVCNLNSFFFQNAYATSFYKGNETFYKNLELAENIKVDLYHSNKIFLYINDEYDLKQIFFLLEYVCGAKSSLFNRLKQINIPFFDVDNLKPPFNKIVYYAPISEIDLLQVNYETAIVAPVYDFYSQIFSYKITLDKDLARHQSQFYLSVKDNIDIYTGEVFFDDETELILKLGEAVKTLKINERNYNHPDSMSKFLFRKQYNSIEYTCDHNSKKNECNIIVCYDEIKKIEEVFPVFYNNKKGLQVSFYDNSSHEGKPSKTWIQKDFSLKNVKKQYAYSLDFKGSFDVDKPDNYQLAVNSDDSMSLLLDDEVIIEHSEAKDKKEKTKTIFLNKGEHSFLISYEQKFGGAFLNLGFRKESYTPFDQKYMVFKQENTNLGVNRKLYSERGKKRKLLKQAIVKDFDLNEYKGMNYLSVDLQSYLRIVEDGYYEFSLFSNKNTSVFINDIPLCYNPEFYKAIASPKIYLVKGYYDIEMRFIMDKRDLVPCLLWKPPSYKDFVEISPMDLYQRIPEE